MVRLIWDNLYNWDNVVKTNRRLGHPKMGLKMTLNKKWECLLFWDLHSCSFGSFVCFIVFLWDSYLKGIKNLCSDSSRFVVFFMYDFLPSLSCFF